MFGKAKKKIHTYFITNTNIQSVTGKNLANIGSLFNLDPRRDPVSSFKATDIGYQTPDSDGWRLPLLKKLMFQRREFFNCEDDTNTIDELIESLCAS